MTKKYTVILSSRVEQMLLRHVEFLARVSVKAARRLRNEYAATVQRLEENPYQFPAEEDPNLPQGVYRRAVFAKRYKAVFKIAGDTVYLDTIVDCRQDSSAIS